jgi:hypothetical protein
MVTCLVWAGVFVIVLLLVLVVGWSIVLAALPLWPPLLVAVIAFYFLTKLRLPKRVALALAGISILAFVIGLPFAWPEYSLAMAQIGYTGAFGGAISIGLTDLPHLFWLSLPFCLLSGAAAGAGLAAVRSLGRAGGGPRRRRREVELSRMQQ